jgi:GH24 family phage-related lysozyme (muramidase)
MKISQKGLDLIKKYEGCRLTAYKPVPTEKYYTIGYGHYSPSVTKGMTITMAIAEQLLREDLAKFERVVNNIGVPLRQHEFDALVCICYNIGEGNFNSSTLRKKVIEKSRKDAEIQAEFKKWNKAGGKVLNGLVKRRAEEAELWML